MSEQEKDPFINALQQQLRESEQGIDELTQARLRAARTKAIETAKAPSRPRWFVPAAAAASIMLVITVTLVTRPLLQDNNATNGELALLEDIDMLSDKTSLELIENLEFYEWLDVNDDKSV